MIDTSTWKEFKLTELFGKAKLGKYHNPKKLQEDDLGYEYICASNFNNGVNANMPKVNGDNITLTDTHIIAWGKQCPYFTYHENACVTSQGMYYYTIGKTPKMAALFICSCLQRLCSIKGYGYTNCLIGSVMDNEIIKLPATPDGEPDWNYMESYMRQIMDETKERLDTLKKKSEAEKHPIDVSEWGEFRVGDYFEVSYGKFIASKFSVEENGYPHITTTSSNNGIGYYVKEPMFDGNAITVASDGNQGASFYQACPFSASNIVSAVVPHDDVPLNKYNAAFLCSIFRKEGEKYSWGGFKYSVDRVRETILHLPVTSEGEPDWDYMEFYMRQIMNKNETKIENLKKTIK